MSQSVVDATVACLPSMNVKLSLVVVVCCGMPDVVSVSEFQV